ncbi:iron-containing alcohol dehydrogenase [Candidatus Aerophobetes bacterium]|nr:iron-containing alcohol dehydrogenase [Candidatus Aerophobetes bacterium]
MLKFGFYLPTRVHFGPGAVQQVGKITRLYGKRAFVVTGRSSAKKLGFLQIIEKKLKEEKIEPFFFQEVEPNPSIDTIEKGVELFNKQRCDVIIGLGGGSPLDAAKVIGVLIKNPPPLSYYFGKNKLKNNPPPFIALPTTSGTGSEVTPYAVVTDTQEKHHPKKIIADARIFPEEALLDPTLTLSLSPTLTSDTGIDALSHAVESFLSKRSFPLSETFALEAVRIIGKYLPRAISHPRDIETRSYLMYASLLAGISIAQTGATLLHAMGYPLTSSFNISHGRANAILFPWFWEYSFPGNPEKFFKIITTLMEEAKEHQAKRAKESALLLKEFLQTCGSLQNMDIKVPEEDLYRFAGEIVENKQRLAVSPKELSFEEVLTIYKKALLI